MATAPPIQLDHEVALDAAPGFSLAQTVAPVAWGRGRWPNHDWIGGSLITVSQDSAGAVIREVRQSGEQICLRSNRDDIDHQSWANRVLGLNQTPIICNDPVIERIANQYPGM